MRESKSEGRERNWTAKEAMEEDASRKRMQRMNAKRRKCRRSEEEEGWKGYRHDHGATRRSEEGEEEGRRQEAHAQRVSKEE